MYDWLTSKTAVAVAAIVILGVMLGFFMFRFSDLEERSLDEEAGRLAGYINDISSKDAEFKIHFTFFEDPSGYELPREVNGEGYDIVISNYQVVLVQNEERSVARLIEPVHGFYPPDRSSLEPADVFTADLLVDNFTVRSGCDFYLESRMYMTPGKDHLVFCYTGDRGQELEKLAGLAGWMEGFLTYDLTDPAQWDVTEERVLEENVTLGRNVVVGEGCLVAFTGIEHLWKPGEDNETRRAELNATDQNHTRLVLAKGSRLVLERRHLVLTDTPLSGGLKAESVEVFAYDGGRA